MPVIRLYERLLRESSRFEWFPDGPIHLFLNCVRVAFQESDLNECVVKTEIFGKSSEFLPTHRLRFREAIQCNIGECEIAVRLCCIRSNLDDLLKHRDGFIVLSN